MPDFPGAVALAPKDRCPAIYVPALSGLVHLCLRPGCRLDRMIAIDKYLHIITEVEPGNGVVGYRSGPHSLQPVESNQRALVDVIKDVGSVCFEDIVEDLEVLRYNRLREFSGLRFYLIFSTLGKGHLCQKQCDQNSSDLHSASFSHREECCA
jgi:hypothetical protein